MNIHKLIEQDLLDWLIINYSFDFILEESEAYYLILIGSVFA